VHERALGLLAVRARSRQELERRLVRAGFDRDDEVTPELRRLERVGLIDDEAFARAVAEHGFGARGEGRRAVGARLRAAGIAPETSEAILEERSADEEPELALDLARRRAPRLTQLPTPTAFHRLTSFLVRRGYAPEVARGAARRALGIVDP
jgi:regulatory protein